MTLVAFPFKSLLSLRKHDTTGLKKKEVKKIHSTGNIP